MGKAEDSLREFLAKKEPVSFRAWVDKLEEIYNDRSGELEAQKLWDFFLLRGINDYAEWIKGISAKDVREKAKEAGMEPLLYWVNSYNHWHSTLTRMLDESAGTRSISVVWLGELMLQQVSIPFTKKGGEIQQSEKNLCPIEIESVVRCIETSRARMDGAKNSDAQVRIKKRTAEIMNQIVNPQTPIRGIHENQ